MSVKRRKIQMELAFTTKSRGEAPIVVDEGTENSWRTDTLKARRKSNHL